MDTRVCAKCKKDLPICDFADNKTKPLGKDYWCRPCSTLAYRERRLKKPSLYQEKDSKYYIKNKEAIISKRANYGIENKHKVSASQAVRAAIISGELVRPGNCERCKKECKPDGHHSDYSKQLEVEWLCKKCHRIEHKRLAATKTLSPTTPIK